MALECTLVKLCQRELKLNCAAGIYVIICEGHSLVCEAIPKGGLLCSKFFQLQQNHHLKTYIRRVIRHENRNILKDADWLRTDAKNNLMLGWLSSDFNI